MHKVAKATTLGTADGVGTSSDGGGGGGGGEGGKEAWAKKTFRAWPARHIAVGCAAAQP